VADRVDPRVHVAQAAVVASVLDRAAPDAELQQLPAADHAVLLAGHARDRLIVGFLAALDALAREQRGRVRRRHAATLTRKASCVARGV